MMRMRVMVQFKTLLLQLLIIVTSISSSAQYSITQSDEDDDPQSSNRAGLVVATKEMLKANYFTFVVLINMISPPDKRFEGNVTFLIPHDSTLASVRIPRDGISDFILRHSIPSPLLFGSLLQFPSGTMIPGSLPDYMMRIYNNGRKDFMLNNIRIISPNICVAGSSIRCHGIDGVLTQETASTYNSTSPPPPPGPACPSSSAPTSPRNLSVSTPPPPQSHFNISPVASPSPSETHIAPKIAGSSFCRWQKGLATSAICLIMSILSFKM